MLYTNIACHTHPRSRITGLLWPFSFTSVHGSPGPDRLMNGSGCASYSDHRLFVVLLGDGAARRGAASSRSCTATTNANASAAANASSAVTHGASATTAAIGDAAAALAASTASALAASTASALASTVCAASTAATDAATDAASDNACSRCADRTATIVRTRILRRARVCPAPETRLVGARVPLGVCHRDRTSSLRARDTLIAENRECSCSCARRACSGARRACSCAHTFHFALLGVGIRGTAVSRVVENGRLVATADRR